MLELFSDYTLQIVAIGSTLLGVLSGVLGVFAVLRKQALIGDAIAHASLPGIVLIFMLTFTKFSPALLLGATISGLIATSIINLIVKYSIIPFDSALALILSSFFGFGMVLLAVVQKIPVATQAGLDKFILGQASTMLKNDVITLLIISAFLYSVLLLLWKEFKLFSFDPEFAKTNGFNITIINSILSSMIVIAIIMGIQTVGVILMSSMLVAPSAAAKQWTNRLSTLVILSGLFGAISGFFGALISSLATKIPTGPVIILILTSITIFSILFGKEHGMIWEHVKRIKQYKEMTTDRILIQLYELERDHIGKQNEHSLFSIDPEIANKQNKKILEKEIEKHILDGLIVRNNDLYSLTNKGKLIVERLLGEENVSIH